jgi:hypothetical protein
VQHTTWLFLELGLTSPGAITERKAASICGLFIKRYANGSQWKVDDGACIVQLQLNDREAGMRHRPEHSICFLTAMNNLPRQTTV